MKIRVTRKYEITTEHEVEFNGDALHDDVVISCAVENNTLVIDTIRQYKNVVDAGCLSDDPKVVLMFPRKRQSLKNAIADDTFPPQVQNTAVSK